MNKKNNKTPPLRFNEFTNKWKGVILNNIVSEIGDGIHSTPLYDEKGSYFFINGNNLVKNHIIFNKDTRKVSLDEYSKYKKDLNSQTILISINGTIGNLAFFNNERIILGKSAAYINLNKDINKNFIINYLQTTNILKYFNSELTGTTIKNLSLKSLKNTPLYLPSIEEQNKIANFLSTIDKKINLLNKTHENLLKFKKYLQQNLLSNKQKQNDEVYPRWNTVFLDELCSICTGNKDLKDTVTDGKYPFFVRSAKIESINSYSYDGEAILIPGDGKIGEVYHYINGKFDYHQRVYKISDFKKNILGKYIYYYLQENFLKQARKYTVKATVDSLRLPIIKKMPIKVPSIDEQVKIASFLTSVDRKISLIQKQIDLMESFKKAMLKQMFV